MKRIAFFSIPAHGHTNPMLPVAAALVHRGNRVRFYAFEPFREKIQATGAEYVSCDSFLPELTQREQAGLLRISATEMTLQDIRITCAMTEFLREEFAAFQPEVIYSDSVCFWGKLSAWKFHVPLVVSTSTFAFNQLSSTYMRQSAQELADLILGLPRISKAMKALALLGYPKKSVMELVQSDNGTNSVVYTTRRFQPYAHSFSGCYAFVGPSVFSQAAPEKKKERPLVYISLGTVLHDKPQFYNHCIQAMKGEPVDVIISCGDQVPLDALEPLPENIQVYPRVDQLEVLSRADVFLTHCGMNSVSESLYMAAPMVLYPQTGEEWAVAKRVQELGAGCFLKTDSPEAIQAAVREVLHTAAYAQAAQTCCEDFRSCPGPEGAAAFIESAPHTIDKDPLKELNRRVGKGRALYWAAAAVLTCLTGPLTSWKLAWLPSLAAGLLSPAAIRRMLKWEYKKAYTENQGK